MRAFCPYAESPDGTVSLDSEKFITVGAIDTGGCSDLGRR